MRILINDSPGTESQYMQIFLEKGYEHNELIFRDGFADTQAFVEQQLEKNRLHIDLIITSRDEEGSRFERMAADKLCYFKNQLTSAYSKGNLRIAAIPLVLYSTAERSALHTFGFDAIVQKNKEGDHRQFVRECERLIRNARRTVLDDLDNLRLKVEDLSLFPYSLKAKEYFKLVRPRADHYFTNLTKAVSQEFIKCPTFLNYDWLHLTQEEMERPYDEFVKKFRRQIKYGGRINERTVWHALLRKYERLIKRDVYDRYSYELNLSEGMGRESQECDFILKTDFEGLLNTTFLEVKREDKRYYTKRKGKRPQYTRKFQADLNQAWDYYKYTINPTYQRELAEKIYATRKFNFVLLAGRREEKEEMQEVFDTDLNDHYPGIQVQSFEDFAEVYENYMAKVNRLALSK